MKNRLSRALALTVGCLMVLEAVLAVVSWLLSATTTVDVRPLLSAEGVRWFCASFTSMVASPMLVWLLLGSMTWGCLHHSRLADGLFTRSRSYRQRLAIRCALGVALLCAGLALWLTCVPHALLLSATGHLWPSPFSQSAVPMLALALTLTATAYGLASRTFQSLADVLAALCAGLSACAPLFVLYVLFIVFYESLRFVFA